jgi:hypothetical protein
MIKLKFNQDKINGLFKDAAGIADKLAKPSEVTAPA